jgi:hypothetical protein
MDLSAFVDAVTQIFQLVMGSSAMATLSAVGLVLLFWQVALFTSLVDGMVFSAAGRARAILGVTKSHKESSIDRAFDNLKSNAQVKRVIRLISFNADLEPERQAPIR